MAKRIAWGAQPNNERDGPRIAGSGSVDRAGSADRQPAGKKNGAAGRQLAWREQKPRWNGGEQVAAAAAAAQVDDAERKAKRKKKKKAKPSFANLPASPAGLQEAPARPYATEAGTDAPPRAEARPVPVAHKPKKAGSERGIETMYRGAYRTQLDLTNLADNKANIMISINGLILSVVLAAGGFVAHADPWLLIPIGALVLTCITAMFFAVQAARPRLPKQTRLTPEDFIAGRANVLFFQNFVALPEDDYVDVVDEIMADRELTYHQMIRHIYGLGTGLKRKFDLLRIAYGAFVVGMIAAALLFFIVYAFSHSGTQAATADGARALAAAPADAPQAALAADQEDAAKFRELPGVYEPSAVHQLPDGRLIVVEDEERQPFDLLTLQADGSLSAVPVLPKTLFEKDGPEDDFRQLDDLEGLDVDDQGYVYALTSHSRTGKGKVKEDREKLVRFQVAGDTFEDPRVVLDLKEALIQAQPALRAAAEITDVKGGNGLNIEGLAFDAGRERLLVGFRSPLMDDKAMLVAIENIDGVFERAEPPRIAPEPVLLEIGGGVRGMTYDPRLDGFLLISGPVETADVQFSLWFWSGDPEERPRAVTVAGLEGFEHAEGITPVRWNGREQILIVSDDGNMDTGKPSHYLLLNYEQLIIEDPPTGTG